MWKKLNSPLFYRGVALNYNYTIRSGRPYDLSAGQFDELWTYYPRVGYVPPRHLPSSSYRPSKLDVPFPNKYKPTDLSMQCYYNQLRKGTIPNAIMGSTDESDMHTILLEEFGHTLIGSSNLKTFQESMDSLDMDKSPGFPLYYHFQSKGRVIANTRAHDALILDVKQWFRPGPLQFTPTPVFTDTPKDELTTEQKADLQVTRLFKNAPFFFLIIGQMLFGNQIEYSQKMFGTHPDTLGIQMPGVQFAALMAELQIHFDKYVAGGCKVLPLSNKLKEFVHEYGGEYGGFFIAMFDTDNNSWDLSMAFTVMLVLLKLRCSCTSTLGSVIFPDGEVIQFHLHSAFQAYYSQTYLGLCVCCGNLYIAMCQKSGGILTTPDNSKGVLIAPYPAWKKFLGPEPIKTWLKGKDKSNGDDGVRVRVFAQIVTIEQLFEEAAKVGCYLATQSNFTKHAEDLMYLSHKCTSIYDKASGMQMMIAVPRLEKLLSGLHWAKRRDEVLTLQRFYAIANGLYGYPERQQVLDIIDRYYMTHPRSRIADAEWKGVLSSRLTDAELFALHTSFDA